MLSRHLILGLVFQVSFRPCWFRAQLRQLNGRPSIPSTLQLEAHQNIVWCRLHRLFTVLELLSIFKNGPWDFVLVPYLFKAPDFSFPVLEGIKQPRLLMVTKMFMNISEANFEQWCAHLQKLCASPSCLCFHGRVLSCFFVSFPLFLTIRLPCLHSLHCDCSASARLKKMSFLFLLHNTAIWFSHVEQNELQCREC